MPLILRLYLYPYLYIPRALRRRKQAFIHLICLFSMSACSGGGLIYLVSKLVKAIAPDPISNTNPIVKIIKKIIAIENPKVDT